MLNSIMREDTI